MKRFFFRFVLVAIGSLVLSSCREPGEGTPEIPGKGENAASDSAFLGLTEKEGADLAASRGLRHRVIAVDGQPKPATRDYRADRVNFELVKGKISAVTRG